MRKYLTLIVFIAIFAVSGCVQNNSDEQPVHEDSQNQAVPFKLYSTSNMWTFIKLDSRNGKMWQVQYSVQGDDYRFETPLNPKSLASETNFAGRFELYATQNMYNFLLLDGLTGDTWQVQWSTEPENQAIIPIK